MPAKVLPAGKTDLTEGLLQNEGKHADHVYLKSPKLLIVQGFRACQAGALLSVCKNNYAPLWGDKEKKSQRIWLW